MRRLNTRLGLLTLAAVLVAAGMSPVQSVAAAPVAAPAPAMATFAAPSGPALQTPAATLASALTCSSDLPTAAKTPILLVPGTVETAEHAYSWGYQKVLLEQGYPVCTVSLPNGGTGDMQTTVEYVVSAVRSMSDTSGKQISVIGHSQGGLLPAAAIRYWPDMASRIDDIVSLDSPYGGTRLADYICDSTHACPALVWQVSRNNDWSRALRRYPVPAGVSYTSIGTSRTDLVFPSPDATYLPGATNLLVQDVCAGRYVDHLGMLSDAPAHAIAMDALTHAGAASLSRISSSICDSLHFAGVDVHRMEQLIWLLEDLLDVLFDAVWLSTEPPLREYAIGALGDTNLALGKPVTVSSTESSSYVGSKAVDGSRSTRWSTSVWNSSDWIYVDLGSTKSVNGVQIQWEAAYADDYRIQRWNGSAWETVWSTTGGGGNNASVALNAVSTRYLRVLMTGGPCCFNNYSMWELQVAGH
ncbi:discoidin domain-containing protein [Nocardioides speluncae]|uniref:galactose-binding domain-containing protein n=1 Tax=Nocardioides speluncae TaxID=2670337 RepID=UPI000D697510|nr:discoidin domain-containing protein [Nocardioides speluncae]